MTGFAIEAYEVHARGYLVKPYEPEKIKAILARYIKSRETKGGREQ